MKTLNFRRKVNEEINYLDWFFKTFPGLKVFLSSKFFFNFFKYYINVQKLKEKSSKEEKKRLNELDDNNCCVILWYFILMVFIKLNLSHNSLLFAYLIL